MNNDITSNDITDNIDEQLKIYYQEEFMTRVVVPSENKKQLLKTIHRIHKNERSWRSVIGYLSAAALIGVASYMSADFLIESKIERNIFFVD